MEPVPQNTVQISKYVLSDLVIITETSSKSVKKCFVYRDLLSRHRVRLSQMCGQKGQFFIDVLRQVLDFGRIYRRRDARVGIFRLVGVKKCTVMALNRTQWQSG